MFIIIIALVIALIATVLRKIYELVVPRETRDISGQVVLVTGGAKGLGREIVLAFAEKKCKIAVVDVDIENANETAKLVGSNAKAYKVDVSNLSEIEELKKKIEADLGPVDIVMNNAGLLFENNFTVEDPKYMEKLIDVNVMAIMWTTRVFLPGMIERKRGHIASISSVFGLIGLVGSPIYTASKFAVRGFMEALTLDLSFRNHSKYIKTSTICPYFIATNEDVVRDYKAGTKYNVAMLNPKNAAAEIVKKMQQSEEIIVLPNFLVHLLYQVTLPLWIKKPIYNYGMRRGFQQNRAQ